MPKFGAWSQEATSTCNAYLEQLATHLQQYIFPLPLLSNRIMGLRLDLWMCPMSQGTREF